MWLYAFSSSSVLLSLHPHNQVSEEYLNFFLTILNTKLRAVINFIKHILCISLKFQEVFYLSFT